MDCGEVMRGDKMIDSIRTAAMEAVVFNVTGTRLELPHGGYGLMGVCNDSAAIIQYALSGKVDIYPLKWSIYHAESLLCCGTSG